MLDIPGTTISEGIDAIRVDADGSTASAFAAVYASSEGRPVVIAAVSLAVSTSIPRAAITMRVNSIAALADCLGEQGSFLLLGKVEWRGTSAADTGWTLCCKERSDLCF